MDKPRQSKEIFNPQNEHLQIKTIDLRSTEAKPIVEPSMQPITEIPSIEQTKSKLDQISNQGIAVKSETARSEIQVKEEPRIVIGSDGAFIGADKLEDIVANFN